MKPILFLIVLVTLILTGCAHTSPQNEVAVNQLKDGISAQAIFEMTYGRHGGNQVSSLKDVNVAVDGDWHFWVTKIQPEVTDVGYRQRSEERLLLTPRLYAANYQGDAGNKRVVRTVENVEVAYNGTQTNDPRKAAATALTADAFYLFVLGPLALADRVATWQRLEDQTLDGKTYYRINGTLSPGVGFSDRDFITLWVDKATLLTFRLHITLEGFESTQGAHVDTTFLDYTEIGSYTLPVHFFERVLGPIRLYAHEWWYMGIDINRGLSEADLTVNGWSEAAAKPAKKASGVKAAGQ